MSFTYSSPTQTTQIKLQQLNQILSVILTSFIGETFSWERVSYGDELKLNFGKTRVQEFSGGRKYKKGEWFLTTSSSLWELQQNKQILLDWHVFEGKSDVQNKAKITKVFQQLVGESVKSIKLEETPAGIQTVFEFTQNFSFIISPQTYDPELIDLWSLFTPTEQVLSLKNQAPFWYCHSIHDRF